MSMETILNKSGSFIVSQMGESKKGAAVRSLPLARGITLAQQTGAGAHEIAERTAEILEGTEAGGPVQWKVYDHELAEQVLEEHHLSKRVARHMPEDRRSCIQDVTEELLGLRPPSWVLVPMVSETIQHLIQAGHVILIGRGAMVVTSNTPGVFHARLVASLPRRAERV